MNSDNNYIKPNFIYKYKAVSSKEDLVRLIDIVNNHRIYMPDYEQLNDPLEGQIVNIECDGYAGMEMTKAADEEDIVVKSRKKEFRILSLARECNNPLLWAHYSNGYEGACLCFSTDDSFSRITKTEYCEDRENVFATDEKDLNKYVKRGLLRKLPV